MMYFTGWKSWNWTMKTAAKKPGAYCEIPGNVEVRIRKEG